MHIGELARRTGVSVRAVRHYHASGLLEAARGPNGYREFDASAVLRVCRIRGLIRAGLTVDDIRPMARCLSTPASAEQFCQPLLELYERKLRALDAEAAALERKRLDLTARLDQMRAQLWARRAAGNGDAPGTPRGPAFPRHDGRTP